ncbi:MAG: sulfatase [Acidobacteriota bacterium]
MNKLTSFFAPAGALVLTALGLGLLTTGCGGSPDRPNVLLISVDTLRADRLGTYGYDRGTSPAIDALGAEAAVFDRAISQSPWTTPSHMSLFTSLHPSSHGVNQGWFEFLAFSRGEAEYRVLPEDVPTLPQLLSDAGYRTRALTGGGTVGAQLGFGRGFEEYRQDARKLRPEHWSQLVDWLEEDDERPFFLFFHTFEVHAPYTHVDDARGVIGDEAADRLEHFYAENPELSENEARKDLERAGLFRVEVTSRLYDGGIRFTDRFLGDFFDQLRQRDLWDDTIVIFLSDHGEEFADHRPNKIYNVHCDALWDVFIHVPLILRVPGRYDDGRRIDGQVSLVDVAPTLLELLDLPIPPTMRGDSLVSRLDGAPAEARRPVFSESPCLGPEWKALRTESYKYIVGFEAPRGERTGIPGPPLHEMLYDLETDPREQVDLSTSDIELRDRMRRRLVRFFTEEATPVGEDAASIEMDEELEEQLRSLGYID